MNEETIRNYLLEIKLLMKSGEFIEAYKQLVFVINNIPYSK